VLEPEHTLTATLGTCKDATSPIVSYEYQWLRCKQYECTDVDDQTNSTFTLPWEMLGAQTEVTAIATDAEGEVGIATSETTDVITYNGPSYTMSETGRLRRHRSHVLRDARRRRGCHRRLHCHDPDPSAADGLGTQSRGSAFGRGSDWLGPPGQP
jgi:hypothetical protein